MNDEKAKPCPFVGCREKRRVSPNGMVCCPDHTRWLEIDDWNRRAPITQAREDLALREKLADLCHEQWSGWMRHLFGKCLPGWDDPKAMVIPAWAVERWTRQMETAYVNLSQDEKESDRKEADRFLAIITSPPPPSKSEDEIRAEVWTAAAKCIDLESKEAMMTAGAQVTSWFCEIRDQFFDRAKSLRSGGARGGK